MTSERPSVVLASAGSGKTHELAGRYIAALGAGAERILATTFTRKAAGEMRSKVLRRLLDAANGAAGAAEALSESCGRRITREEARGLLLELLRGIDRLRIQTLDSFFAEVGRLFSAELGLLPGWRILDEIESDEVTRVAVDGLLTRLSADALLTILEGMSGGPISMMPRREILQRISQLHQAYLDCGADVSVWGTITAPEEPLSAEQLLELLRNAPPALKKDSSPAASVRKVRDGLEELVRQRDWRGIAESTIVQSVLDGSDTYGQVKLPAELTGALRVLGKCAGCRIINQLADRTRAAGGIVQAYDKTLWAEKLRRNAICFDDLPRALRTLSSEASDWLWFRLDAKLDHVLLDEFQDTSRSQFLAIEPLLREIAQQRSSGRSIFAVGDVKQSIYGWRGAVPELLAGLADRLSLGTPGTRAQSYRSSPAILKAVNLVFQSIDSNPALAEYADAAANWRRHFEPHAANRDLAGEARLLQTRPPTEAEDGANLVLDMAAARVRSLLQEHPEWSIGVLSRRNDPIAALTHRLRAMDVPAAQESGQPLTDEPSVGAFLSVLQLAEHPGDSASQFHVGKSAFANPLGLTAPLDRAAGERLSSDLREKIARQGVSGLCGWLRNEVYERLSARGRDRLERVEKLALGFDAKPGGKISDFIRLIETAGVGAAAPGVVSVLTVHRAKGLEWDAVVLIDLETNWKKFSPKIVADRGEAGETNPLAPVQAVTLWPTGKIQKVEPRFQAIARRYWMRQIRESLSGLYVGMTRARSRMEIIVEGCEKAKCSLNSASVLRAALAPGAPTSQEGEIWSTQSAGDAGRQRPGKAPDSPRPVSLRFRRTESAADRALSPSARKGARDVASILANAEWSLPALRIGHVWHAWFERVEWRDGWLPEEVGALALAARFGMNEADSREQWALFQAAMKGNIGAALSRKRYQDESLQLKREWALAWMEEGLTVGRIDRVVIGLRDSMPAWAEILDFKTDRVEERRVSEAAEGYREQMAAYRRAVAGALGLAGSSVRSFLLFCGPGVVVECD
ncbi:MAG: UvrD-helicase domain-containing protein [Phycisphaerales bacterium]|nr:UvrD-helicase domain-containing protein [Planctomycetota bacterium]